MENKNVNLNGKEFDNIHKKSDGLEPVVYEALEPVVYADLDPVADFGNENTNVDPTIDYDSDKKKEKDYARLIAAQNESERRLKISAINRTLKEENRQKNAMAIISGISIVGVAVATHFSGIDPKEALATEIKALNSFESLKDYFSMITPAMYATILSAAGSITAYIRHKRRYDNANQEFFDMVNNEPEIYQDIVETQAKNR